MTGKQFFDWQTSGGTDDVMRLVEAHPRLWESLTPELRQLVHRPES